MVNIVGLTGGIACGKSTVVDVLREHNFAIIDCDKIAREIAKNEKVLQELLHSFGPSIIAEDGSLLRKELGRIIFQDESKRRILGSIMGKRIGYAISRSLLYHFTVGTLCVIIDAPTLYETKSLLNIVGDVVLVSTNEHIQLERLMRRDESTKEDALARIRAQMPLKVKEKHPRTSIILTNNGSLEDIRAKANALAIQLRKRTSFSSRFMSLPGFLMSIVIAILAAYLFDGIRQRVGVDGSGTDPDFMTSNL